MVGTSGSRTAKKKKDVHLYFGTPARGRDSDTEEGKQEREVVPVTNVHFSVLRFELAINKRYYHRRVGTLMKDKTFNRP